MDCKCIFTSKKRHTSPLRKMQDLKRESNFGQRKYKKHWHWNRPFWTKAKGLHYKNTSSTQMLWFLKVSWVKKRDPGLLFLRPWAELKERSSLVWCSGQTEAAGWLSATGKLYWKLVSALGRSVSWVMLNTKYWHHYPTAFTHWFSMILPGVCSGKKGQNTVPW